MHPGFPLDPIPKRPDQEEPLGGEWVAMIFAVVVLPALGAIVLLSS